VGGPKWDNLKGEARPEWPVLYMRKEFGLFGNIRPVKLYSPLVNTINLKPELVQGLDIIVLRENTGGVYYGQPKKQWEEAGCRKAVDTMVYSEKEIERIIRLGFELARGRRKKLSSVDKINVLETSQLWNQIANELAPEYPDVQLDHVLADACAMRLIQSPTTFDVLVMANLFGDILSDEASMLAGSLGMMGSACLAGLPRNGEVVFGLYESAHGSAPARAGLNMINPIAEIHGIALMLQYSFGLEKEAQTIYAAIEEVLLEHRTYDIMEPNKKQVGTIEMGDLIAKTITG
jgi:3-isopropylmalate dehydrogenase